MMESGATEDSHARPLLLSQFAATLDAINDGVVWVGMDATLQWCNRRFEEWLGLTRSQLAGLSLLELLPLSQEGLPISEANHPATIVRKENLSPQCYTLHRPGKTGDRMSANLESSERIIEISGQPLPSEETSPLMMLILKDVTAFQKAQTQFQETHEQLLTANAELRSLFQGMTDIVFVLNDQGYYCKAAPTQSPYFYQQPHKIVGRHLREILPPHRAEEFLGYIRQVTQTQEPLLVEYSLQFGDREAWFSTRIAPISTHEVIWMAREVTSLKQAELALREQEAQYRDLVQTANCIIIRWDGNGIIHFINDYGLAFFGYHVDELIGQPALGTIIPEEDAEGNSLREWVEDLCRNPIFYALHENENRRSNGDRVWMVWSNKPIFNAQGELIEILSVGTDATERKAAVIALERSLSLLQTIFEAMTEGVLAVQSSSRDLMFNQVFLEMWGLTEESLNSAEPSQRLQILADRTKDPENFIRRVVEIYQNPDQDSYDFLHLVDGRIFERYSRAQRLAGKDIGRVWTYRDITDRVLAEQALREEQYKSEQLLLSILPEPIAEQLKQNPGPIAEQFDEVSVLFADIVGFTQFSQRIPPDRLVSLLNEVFSIFDQLSEQYKLEKIKTLGDAYMVVGGLPYPHEDHATAIAQMALNMQRAMKQYTIAEGNPITLRIGINTGSVVAGVIGKKKFIYDLWGDTVNVASRMESQGEPGKIQVTHEVYQRLKHRFSFEKRGVIAVKGRGKMVTYWLTQ